MLVYGVWHVVLYVHFAISYIFLADRFSPFFLWRGIGEVLTEILFAPVLLEQLLVFVDLLFLAVNDVKGPLYFGV